MNRRENRSYSYFACNQMKIKSKYMYVCVCQIDFSCLPVPPALLPPAASDSDSRCAFALSPAASAPVGR